MTNDDDVFVVCMRLFIMSMLFTYKCTQLSLSLGFSLAFEQKKYQ